MRKRLIKILNALIITICLSYLILSNVTIAKAADAVDVIAKTADNAWFQTESGAGEGTWTVSNGTLSVDSYGGNYAMDGATYLTNEGRAIGSFEFETTINIESVNAEQASPMVGIIPWYVDDDNYLYVSLKFANISLMNSDDPLLDLATDAEKADGAILEQILVSGRLNGESKYYEANAQQENSVFDTVDVGELKTNRLNPTSATGHTIKVVFEDRSAMASQYITTVYYNGIKVGETHIYYYNSVVENLAVGFLAQDVKATYSNAKLTDNLLTYSQDPTLGRDWKENNGFIYRTLNANDVWTFNNDETITFNTKELEDGSVYSVDGANLAGYNTARGYTLNPVKETTDGVPQNYEVSARFKLDEALANKQKGAFGLIPWYQDDRNYIDVLIQVYKAKATQQIPTSTLILSGWLNGSNASVGKTTVSLPETFDPMSYHEIKVEKKSTGFYVYLDGELLISKNVLGTENNYFYGYNGYNSVYTATKISSNAIYEAYDEIVVKSAEGDLYKVSSAAKDSWVLETDNISISAKEDKTVFTNRSYLIGYSDVTDVNMSLEMTANVSLGIPQFSELMLSPYILDENNFARIGLAWHDGKTYARVHASTYIMNDDGTYPEAPTVTRLEYEISDVSTEEAITLKAEKVEKRLVLYVNGSMVYGVDVEGINQQANNYGIYISNMDLSISNFETIGYKKYTRYDLPGGWITSGIKYNQWTITNEGHLIGDATYTENMVSDEEDGERNYAIKKLPVAQSVNYQMTVRIRQVGESKTSDRVGVMMWYVDDDNFMVFYLDRWRGDSATPRTTIYGRINGQTLPTKYNHGAWLPEGEEIVECNCASSCACGGNCVGQTSTECSGTCGEDAPCKSLTDTSQVTEWHTITVKKTGNQFVCYVDDNLGARTYTVDAGLPDTTGKTVYAGIYTLNDAVEVSQYNISTVGATPTPATPCEAGSPYSDAVVAPTIGTYAAVSYKDEIETGKEIPYPSLDVPTVTISNSGLASWEAVTDAVKYMYKIDGVECETTECSVQLSDGQAIQVKAISDGTTSSDSEYSESQTYVDARTSLTAPTVTIDQSTGVATWTEVTNAIGYKYKIDGGEEVSTTECSVTLEVGQAIQVKAVANIDEYLDSDYSGSVAYFGQSSDGSYTVIFYAADGSVLQTITVSEGETAVYSGQTPTKAEENGISYEFSGWDVSLENITNNMTVNPVFDKSYNVTFKNYDDSIITTIKVKEGENATYTGETPTKPQEGYTGYEFSGWDGSLENITKVTVLKATFTEVDLTPIFKVTFKNYDGSVLLEVTVKEGENATYTGETPTKPATDKFTYEFSGWDKTLENITADTVITALYKEISTVVAVKLSRPFVVIDVNGLATWNAVSGAIGYAVYINGAETPVTITECSYQLSDGDTIVVVAAGDGLEILDSNPSISQKYIAPVVPEEPERKGCGASIVSSLFGIITLAGAVVLVRKKRS